MWTSNGKNGIDGPVAAWGVLVDNHEYYALSMVANTGVIVIGKKTPREQD
ncbi:MAG TPA: hypothetical protein VN682_22730 [Terriglobales bacterium]|nr:hypothetical protein [Terriglobales bacterium]